MKEVAGNFWMYLDKEKPQAIVCTVNQIIKTDGCLVMGAGIAKDFALNYKWLPKSWGSRMLEYKRHSGKIPSMFVTLMKTEPHLIALSTKYHFKDPSDINLIVDGINWLQNLVEMTGWSKILMTRPGCGMGGLDWKDISPLLSQILDDRFIVCNR